MGLFGRKKDDDPKKRVVGGLPFLISLIVLIPSSCAAFLLALSLLSWQSLSATAVFLLSAPCGAFLAHRFIRGHFSVFLHEFKHSLASGLVGNKAKKMKIEKDSGYFKYTYTKETDHFNTIISLAPYIIPVFTILFGLLAIPLGFSYHTLAASLMGLGYGIDLLLNIRDISPIQSDLYCIRGGLRIAVLFILTWNILFSAFLLAWVFQGVDGWLYILEKSSIGFVSLHQWISGEQGVSEE